MTEPNITDFSNYVVFANESGDHGLANIDPDYPMFVLAFCIFHKREYMDIVCPAMQRLKFAHWGHDKLTKFWSLNSAVVRKERYRDGV